MAEPITFDPAAFVADFRDAGCSIDLCVSNDGSLKGFAIKSGKGYGATMLRWADALDDCPDYYEQIVELLQQEEVARV